MLCNTSILSFTTARAPPRYRTPHLKSSPRASMENLGEPYNREEELKSFDATKKGVKGLVDGGIKSIPRMFIHEVDDSRPPRGDISIPTIDLEGIHSSHQKRARAVKEITRASRELGFFQLINHGAPIEAIDSVLKSIKDFHELPHEAKSPLYDRDRMGVNYVANVDLYKSTAATWRDTIQIVAGPLRPEVVNLIPEVCKKEVLEWAEHGALICELVMEMICEGLGLEKGALRDLSCSKGRQMVGHYYPFCPEPDLTKGLGTHTDPGVLTVLLQDEVGGLQVRVGEDWVPVRPVKGSVVINVGDMLQMVTNDECISVEHRVVANKGHVPRVSVAIFFISSERERVLEPFEKLVSPEKPPVYRRFTTAEYMRAFVSKKIGDKALREQFKIE